MTDVDFLGAGRERFAGRLLRISPKDLNDEMRVAYCARLSPGGRARGRLRRRRNEGCEQGQGQTRAGGQGCREVIIAAALGRVSASGPFPDVVKSPTCDRGQCASLRATS